MSLAALRYTYRDLLKNKENEEYVKNTIRFLSSTDIYFDGFLKEAKDKINHLKEIGEDKLYERLKGFPN